MNTDVLPEDKRPPLILEKNHSFIPNSYGSLSESLSGKLSILRNETKYKRQKLLLLSPSDFQLIFSQTGQDSIFEDQRYDFAFSGNFPNEVNDNIPRQGHTSADDGRDSRSQESEPSQQDSYFDNLSLELVENIPREFVTTQSQSEKECTGNNQQIFTEEASTRDIIFDSSSSTFLMIPDIPSDIISTSFDTGRQVSSIIGDADARTLNEEPLSQIPSNG